MDPITILAALAPMIVDAGKGLIGKYINTDGYKAANIDEFAKMKQIDLDMFKAMNEAGGANPSYPWVEAVVRLMRPGIAITVLSVWAISHLSNMPVADIATVDNYASAIGFYLFGDRTLFYSKQIGVKK